MNNANNVFPVGLQKWDNAFQNNLNWDKILYMCHTSTKECKLKWFQYRLLHRVLPTNRFLCLRGIKDDSLCHFCHGQEESISHLFWSCEIVNKFWVDLQNLLLNGCDHIVNLQFDEELVIFGTRPNMYTDKVFDLILLVAKYYIYSLKWSNSIPNIRTFHGIIKTRYRLEKYANSSQIHKFNMLWYPYNNIIT